jgi:GTPase Era involved in 16S rRNA processing
MGITGSGKSTFIKEVTGQDVPVGSGISSTTTQVKTYEATVDGQKVLLVDTPGFDDSEKTEGEILRNITSKLASLHIGDIPISGVIYTHDITAEKIWTT